MARRHRRTSSASVVSAESYRGPERRRFVNRSWPLPALAAWAACWLVYIVAVGSGVGNAVAFIVAGLIGAGFALLGATPWRRVFIGCGFPLSIAAFDGAANLPTWVWLLPLALLALAYPWRTWRDAPLFPTPTGALAGLARHVPLAPDARVLDAGCGLGDGLRELRREYADAALDGIEWSWPLRLMCAWRCGDAVVRRADLWATDWSPYALVYLFQRPESIARAMAKASRELAPGAWLVSLEFEATAFSPAQVLRSGDGKPVWIYRAPFANRADEAPR